MRKTLLSLIGAVALNAFAGCAVVDKDQKFVYPEAVKELASRNAYYSLEGIALEKNQLYAGASAVEITPPTPQYIAGFQVGRKSDGVLDELFARTIVLSYDDTTVALVSLDLIGFMNENVGDVRHLVSRIKGCGIDEIIISSTHTHAGPDTIGMWGPGLLVIPVGSGIDENYMKFLHDKIVESIYRAAKGVKKARLFYASKTVGANKKISRNIREGLADDIDRELNVLQLVGENNETIATMVNYGCHPEALSYKNTKFSSDFASSLRDEVEKKHEGLCAYFQGSIGGLVSVDVDDDKWRDTKYGRQEMERIGKTLAKEVDDCLQQKKECSAPEIIVRRKDFFVPVDNWLFKFANNVGLIAKRDYGGNVKTRMVLVDIGGKIKMLTVPGEISPSLGNKLKELMNCEQEMIIGLSPDENGYILDDYNHPSLGYERGMSLGQSTGKIILEQGKELTRTKTP